MLMLLSTHVTSVLILPRLWASIGVTRSYSSRPFLCALDPTYVQTHVHTYFILVHASPHRYPSRVLVTLLCWHDICSDRHPQPLQQDHAPLLHPPDPQLFVQFLIAVCKKGAGRHRFYHMSKVNAYIGEGGGGLERKSVFEAFCHMCWSSKHL